MAYHHFGRIIKCYIIKRISLCPPFLANRVWSDYNFTELMSYDSVEKNWQPIEKETQGYYDNWGNR